MSHVTDDAGYRGRLQQALGTRYELQELIGSGGFGTVFAVWDDKLRRKVAVKALHPELFSEVALLERFRREAETLAQLQHPHIVTVFDVGEDEGLMYMVMQLINGESLETLAYHLSPPWP